MFNTWLIAKWKKRRESHKKFNNWRDRDVEGEKINKKYSSTENLQVTLGVPMLNFAFFISFILLTLSTFTFFNVVSYVWKPPTHCQPSILLCFQALFKTHYLTAPLLAYPGFFMPSPFWTVFIFSVIQSWPFWKTFMLGTMLNVFFLSVFCVCFGVFLFVCFLFFCKA